MGGGQPNADEIEVASGTYPESRGSPIADFYGAELLSFPHLHHVSLVNDGVVRAAIADWLSRYT